MTRHSHRVRRLTVGVLTLVMGVTTSALALPAAEASGHGYGFGRHASYVALGDSYASGEGLVPYEQGTDTATNSCHRSTDDSYPELLERSDVRAYNRLTSVACSGATTASLFTTLTPGGPAPQLSALTARTRTVTVTIGGNDAGFAQVLSACVYAPVADPQVQATIQGQPECRTSLNKPVSARILNLARPQSQLPPTVSLPQVLARIHARAPQAQIYVSTYPQLVGTKFNSPYGCQVGSVGPVPLAITAADARWIRTKATQLNAAIAVSVAEARYAGQPVHLVRVDRRFQGHNLCDSRSPWLNPVLLDASGVSRASFHPTARGQSAFAAAFERAAGS